MVARLNAVGSTEQFVFEVYRKMSENLNKLRQRTNKPLTLADKILLTHLDDPGHAEIEVGESYLQLRPDRVAHQDVTGQMAILQFMQAGKDRVAVPTTVHCDHLIQANLGREPDTAKAILENNEVYKFLESASAKYGMGFWRPGAGIIHQVVLENYAFPGGLMIGTDSHTPNASGLGMLAIGVGGADGADVMAGLTWELKYPKRIGIHLTGKLQGWTAPKDVILFLASVLTVSGGTNAIIEYFGPGARSISCTGKATISNMGAELGATGSLFPYDAHMSRYLHATKRGHLASLADCNIHLLEADPEVEAFPENFFERIIEINLSELEPYVAGPHTPDLARPISQLAEEVSKMGYLDEISVALIGSCTNSSYEDMSRASDIALQAQKHGGKSAVPILVTPGSEQIRATIERDGQMDALRKIDAKVLANACGPCIGQWNRAESEKGKPNTIVTSYNRNFPKRNDGSGQTMNFIASPEIVVAFGLAGRLTFNPMKDNLQSVDGTPYKLEAPNIAPDVPSNGFVEGDDTYVEPPENGDHIDVVIDPSSNRLQVLEPFAVWDGGDFIESALLVKVVGKCTTDHISPAGPWLRFRGHLDNLSENMLTGAVNSYSGEVGIGFDHISGERNVSLPEIARRYKRSGVQWVVVGDSNYGEGSSREHAALSPRHLGAVAIIVRSFARIHETNLKKQGLLALTFTDPDDYDLVQEQDRISLLGLKDLTPGKAIDCVLHHIDGSRDMIQLTHTYNKSQIMWFKAGSALNLLRNTL